MRCDLDKDVVQFFEDNGCLLTYLLDPRKQPTKLNDAQVKAGAESYYEKLQSGEIKARANQYAAGVWEEAKHVKYDQFLKDNEILEHHKKIIEALEITIKRTVRKIYLSSVLGIILGGLAVYNLYKYGYLICQ